MDGSLQPDSEGLILHRFPRGRVHEGAAAGREDMGWLAQQPGNHPPLAIAKIGLAVFLENLGYGKPAAASIS
jgi:hypothetical protein